MSIGRSTLGSFALSSSARLAATSAKTVTGTVSGVASTAVGTPAGVYLSTITGIVSGFSSTAVGRPIRFIQPTVCSVGGVSTTSIGTPSAFQPIIYGLVATSVKTTRMGGPVGTLLPFAPSAGSGAKVGIPKAKSNRFTCVVEGMAQTIGFGVPGSESRLFVQAKSPTPGFVGVPFCAFDQYGIASWPVSTRIGWPRRPLPVADVDLFVRKRVARIDVLTERL